MKNVIEHLFSNPTTTTYNSGSTTFIGSGNFIKQYKGLTSSDNYITPFKLAVGRPMEASTSVTASYPWVYSFSDNIDWVFLVDVSVTTTKRIILYEYNKKLNEHCAKYGHSES